MVIPLFVPTLGYVGRIIPTLASRRIKTDLFFISSLLDGLNRYI